jgi:hypothetical protein
VGGEAGQHGHGPAAQARPGRGRGGQGVGSASRPPGADEGVDPEVAEEGGDVGAGAGDEPTGGGVGPAVPGPGVAEHPQTPGAGGGREGRRKDGRSRRAVVDDEERGPGRSLDHEVDSTPVVGGQTVHDLIVADPSEAQ